MGLFSSNYEKAEKYLQKGDYGKAAIYYRNGWYDGNDDYGHYHTMRLALLYTDEVSKALKINTEELLSDALDYLFHHGGDAGLDLVARYYIDSCKKLSYTERYNKVLECLDLMKDKKHYRYESLQKYMSSLESLAKAQIAEREAYLSKRTDYEIKMGIERINQKGAFYDCIEKHPNEKITDLAKGTNYYGRFVDNFYGNAYRAGYNSNIDGWGISVATTTDEPILEGDTVYRQLKVEIKRVPLYGRGIRYSVSRYDISSSRQSEIKKAFLDSNARLKAERNFFDKVIDLFGNQYVSGYGIKVKITSVSFASEVIFDYYYEY